MTPENYQLIGEVTKTISVRMPNKQFRIVVPINRAPVSAVATSYDLKLMTIDWNGTTEESYIQGETNSYATTAPLTISFAKEPHDYYRRGILMAITNVSPLTYNGPLTLLFGNADFDGTFGETAPGKMVIPNFLLKPGETIKVRIKGWDQLFHKGDAIRPSIQMISSTSEMGSAVFPRFVDPVNGVRWSP